MGPEVQLYVIERSQLKTRVRDEMMAHTPPDVGAADANSAIDIPTRRMKRLATSH